MRARAFMQVALTSTKSNRAAKQALSLTCYFPHPSKASEAKPVSTPLLVNQVTVSFSNQHITM